MGNYSQATADPASEDDSDIDRIEPLSLDARRHLLIDGYSRSQTTAKTLIPDDIKSILNAYLQSMMTIKSRTEIELEVFGFKYWRLH